MAKISLRAAKAEDLPRLRVLWRESFGEEHEAWFFRQCFVPGHVESSLVLLEDGIVQSMVFLLPAFWYSGAQDRYAPAPCLVGLATDPVRRHQNYAGWLVETACDFLVEKRGWRRLDAAAGQYAGAFFREAGVLVGGERRRKTFGAADLPESCGVCRRSSSEAYERRREKFLQGRSHVVLGPALTALQWELAERSGGGLFQITLPGGETACAIAFKKGGTAVIRELLGGGRAGTGGDGSAGAGIGDRTVRVQYAARHVAPDGLLCQDGAARGISGLRTTLDKKNGSAAGRTIFSYNSTPCIALCSGRCRTKQRKAPPPGLAEAQFFLISAIRVRGGHLQ